MIMNYTYSKIVIFMYHAKYTTIICFHVLFFLERHIQCAIILADITICMRPIIV